MHWLLVLLSICSVNSCITNEDCSNHGVCTMKVNNITVPNYCECDHGYTTFPQDNVIKCNYKMKNRYLAYVLEILIGLYTGAGNMYLENYAYAITSLLLFWIPLIIFCITGRRRKDPCDEGLFFWCVLLWFFGIMIYWIVRTSLINNGNITDHNNVTTYGIFIS